MTKQSIEHEPCYTAERFLLGFSIFFISKEGHKIFQNINLGIAPKCTRTCHCTKVCGPEHLRIEDFRNSVLGAFPNFRVKHNLNVSQNWFLRKIKKSKAVP
jgi:hypothetical protein